jgi:hypothetical protein
MAEPERARFVARRPAVIVLADEDAAFDAARPLADAVERATGARPFVSVEDAALVLPPPWEVWRDGRSLRGEEYGPYGDACLAAARALSPRAIRFAVEVIVRLDTSAFGASAWATLDAAFASLPGFLGDAKRPAWLGRDARLGPSITASVEPGGLHVLGVVEVDVLDAWLARLVEATRALPARP